MKIVLIPAACLWASVCFAEEAADVAKKSGDAAIQVREGDVNQWIEYYRNQNNPATQKRSRESAAGQAHEKGAPVADPTIAPNERNQK
jgi:hypothetical protein